MVHSTVSDRAPLMSVMIPNFNHSRFLDECLESVLAQTYPNIEVAVVDNQSSDDSIPRLRRYLDRGVRVCRNATNRLNFSYRILGQLTSGEYMMLLGADDAIAPTFIEKAVALMQAFPTVGYVHAERDFVTPDGRLHELDPFYRCSFVAPGASDTPVYMVTTVAHSSQAVFRRTAFRRVNGFDQVIDHMNVDRTLWFYLSQVSDYGYIREKMARIRVGGHTETSLTQKNFQHPVLCHLTVKEFANQARARGLERVYGREAEGLRKLAVENLEVVARLAREGDFGLAERYLAYCLVISPELAQDSAYQRLERICRLRELDQDFLCQLCERGFVRKRSYDAPEGFREIVYDGDGRWRQCV
jgi:glycosyltransferase involved in cell wall biosynthesis